MLHKRFGSVQRNKSRRTGATKASRDCCTNNISTTTTTTATIQTGNYRHRYLQEQQETEREQEEGLKMTSHVRQCVWQLWIIILGFCAIGAGVYLLNNWIDIFTRMRGKVSQEFSLFIVVKFIIISSQSFRILSYLTTHTQEIYICTNDHQSSAVPMRRLWTLKSSRSSISQLPKRSRGVN